MEKEQLLESETYPLADEPHFDEEWTVLTARPVVPLEKVAAKSARRRLKLAAAFVVAIMLGALAALAAVYLQGTANIADESTPSTGESQISQSEEPGNAPNATTQNETVKYPGKSEAEAVVVPKTPVRVSETTKNSSVNRHQAEPATEPAKIDTTLSTSDAEPRLVDQWQERRPRRTRVKRLRRERNARQERDLLRIREIFEGPRP